jgi:mutator protein MutT
VLIYATSNRRHLLPEYMKENLTYKHTDDGEVHPGEVVEEKISLSERFGLWVVSPVQPGRVPRDRRPVVAIRRRRGRDPQRPAGVARLGAGARFALGPRRVPVRSRLQRARRIGPGVSDGQREPRRPVDAEGHEPRRPVDVEGHEPRRPVDVAVGVLIDAEGRFLLTSRPAGKVYAGYWEFPGGKLEAGETVEQALRRELHEELGITIAAAEPWQVELFDYPHALVRLHFCKVFAWTGAFEMREGQKMAWQARRSRSRRCCPSHCRSCVGLPRSAVSAARGTSPVTRALPRAIGSACYTAPMSWLDEVKWDAQGLLPVIAQEAGSGDVLMVAWMNREALAQTAARGEAVYWSRSRELVAQAGEESGHVQKARDAARRHADVLLLRSRSSATSPDACHTGRHPAFRRLEGGAWVEVEPVLKDPASIYR